MAIVTFVHPDGRRTEIVAWPGESLMECAVENDIAEIRAECGGSAVCGTCHVFIDPADLVRLPPPSALESELLDGTAVPRRANSRLSCQVKVDAAGLTVHLPERQS
jgi:2Fe-2S ferredoxin